MIEPWKIVATDICNHLDAHEDCKLYLDFDGVIAQSVKSILKICNSKLEPKDIYTWNFAELGAELGYTLTEQDVEGLFCRPQFFSELEYYDGVRDILDKYSDRIVVITKGTPKNIMLKSMWLNSDYPTIPVIGIPMNVSKSIIDFKHFDLFVDDCVTNFNYCKGVNILFKEFADRDWNKCWNGYVLESWK